MVGFVKAHGRASLRKPDRFLLLDVWPCVLTSLENNGLKLFH
jgi:hypothetical protein